MTPLDLADIVNRLLDLRAFSPALAMKLAHEDELPQDAVPFLVDRIEEAFARCGDGSGSDKSAAFEMLAEWLIRGYRFYICRLALAPGRPWCFSFPSRERHDEYEH